MEEDELLPSLDPDNPCPKCGAIPWAPVDGVNRICDKCHWYWSVTHPEDGRYFKLKMR